MKRLDYNRKIIDILKGEVEKYPNWRFGQLIQNLGVVDRGDCFFIESQESYENLCSYLRIEKDCSKKEPIEILKNKVIFINGKEEGKAVQEKLFRLGFSWGGLKKKFPLDIDNVYLFVNDDLTITYADNFNRREIIDGSTFLTSEEFYFE